MVKASYVIYAGLAAGIVAIAAGMVLATANQQANIPDTAVPSSANLEGPIESESGWGAVLNKERWHEDPFADEAAEIKAKWEAAQSGQ